MKYEILVTLILFIGIVGAVTISNEDVNGVKILQSIPTTSSFDNNTQTVNNSNCWLGLCSVPVRTIVFGDANDKPTTEISFNYDPDLFLLNVLNITGYTAEFFSPAYDGKVYINKFVNIPLVVSIDSSVGATGGAWFSDIFGWGNVYLVKDGYGLISDTPILAPNICYTNGSQCNLTLYDSRFYTKSETYNKSEINDLIPSLLTYYFWDVNSTVNLTYKIMNTTQNPTITNHTANGLLNGNVIVYRLNKDTNLTGLSGGSLHLHTSASKTLGTKDLQIKGILAKVNTSGFVTDLLTTDTSPILITGAYTNLNLFASVPTPITLNITDRLLWRLQAVVTGAGTNPSVNISVGGMTQNGLDLPITVSDIHLSEADPLSWHKNDVGELGNFTTTGNVTANTFIGNGIIPIGGIIMYSGNSTQLNNPCWAFANGSNGTPDLRNKFIIQAHNFTADILKTNITGTYAQSGGVASHTHTIGSTLGAADGVDRNADPDFNTGSSLNIPPYYTLAYIQRTC